MHPQAEVTEVETLAAITTVVGWGRQWSEELTRQRWQAERLEGEANAVNRGTQRLVDDLDAVVTKAEEYDGPPEQLAAALRSFINRVSIILSQRADIGRQGIAAYDKEAHALVTMFETEIQQDEPKDES